MNSDQHATMNMGKVLHKSVVLHVRMKGVRRAKARVALCRWIIQFAGLVGGFKRIECAFDVEVKK